MTERLKTPIMARILVIHFGNSRPYYANQLFQSLSAHFGIDRVQFPSTLGADRLPAADMLRTDSVTGDILVVVFERYQPAASIGRLRSDLTENSLRDVILSAINSNIRLVPVLVDNAGMPNIDELPNELKQLARTRPVHLHSDRWDRDISQLIRRLEKLIVTQGKEVQAIPAPPPESKARPGRFDRLKSVFSRWFRYRGSQPLPTAKNTESPPLYERGASELRPETDETQDVYLGASAPAALRPGEEFTARFVAYMEHEKVFVKEILHRLSPRSTSALDIKRCRWQPGTKVTISLSGRWLEVQEARQTFIWDAAYVVLDFDVMLASDAPQGTTVLKFDVAIDGIRVAKLRIDLQVGDTRESQQSTTVVTGAARTAFASYSSQDRQRVLDRLASVRISAGLDVFLDCLSLRPGERWKLKITEEIRSRDQFLLFWSKAAADSQWVTWEWQTALNEKGIEDMQIHPLENNVAPPVELTDLHFSDVLVAIRGADS
jgi:hypothetical protein